VPKIGEGVGFVVGGKKLDEEGEKKRDKQSAKRGGSFLIKNCC